ncbi:alkaline phosphatase family protein [Snuella lapsa]|uniref:LamG-like jellyroll fold domain-containing protein n=1 Tax=Snuella lapsa TaxID=870481 RepID=A0ABP6WXU3_9FLAO
MNKYLRLSILCFFLSITSCSKSSDTSNPEPEPDKTILKKVLLIGIDGCRPDALTEANTPHLDALMANGTYSLDARNTKTTSSGPGWSAMLTGVWEDKHGVTDNSFNGANFSNYPHFFKYIKENNVSNRTVSISQWHPINTNIALDHADATINTQDLTSDVKNKAIAELASEDLTALFVHFDDADHAGHSTGFSPTNPNYLNAIETIDIAIGSVISSLKVRSNYDKEDWLILVSTDHGGFGTSHGGNSEEERTIFVIASGDGIPQKEIAKTTTQTTIPPAENCLASTTELWFGGNTSITVPNNTVHNFGSSQDFSIECRFRANTPNDVSIVAKKDWDSGILPGYVFSFKPSSRKFKVNIGDGTNRVDVETEEITDNKWHTVSATFDRDGMLHVYVDGVLKNSASMTNINNIDNTLPFTVGTDGNGAYGYSGYISEIRIFNTLLSADEIDNWKCKVLDNTHTKYANLQGHWKLTEGTGTLINDASPNGVHGTLTEGIWKDATASEVIDTYNYDNTPRTVDVAVTALNHLCIPIKPEWNLDGNSIIESNCDQ